MAITQSTYISALILFLVTGIVIYGILNLTSPSFVLNYDKKFSMKKTIVVSTLISAIFTMFISYISIKIQQNQPTTQK
jgi:predicted permease